MSALLGVDHLSFGFSGHPVLDAVSFEANAGEFIAIAGCNGAGKSTLLDLIAGLRTPDAGAVFLEGRPIPAWPARELSRRMSHLPQAVRLDLPFSVEQLVLMGRYPHTHSWFESAEDRAAVETAMERTNCLQDRHRRFVTLSGGERQRVLLAACLAQQASVFLLDEPSTFLDISQQLHCFTLLQEEARQGKLCIAVTHDLNLALTYCSRLIVLAGNKVEIDLNTCDASMSSAWLDLFSPKLRMGKTPEGTPWVWYQ